MRVSASLIKTWMSCPLQARFRYMDKLPDVSNAKAAFGSCVHLALEYYNTHDGDISGALAKFLDAWDDPAKIGSPFSYWPRGSTYGGLQNRGIEILREYHDKQKWESRYVVAAEHKFVVPFGDHELSGIVDLLETKKSGRGKNTLKIVDYKTNSVAPKEMQLRLDIQFTAYAYAVEQPEFWVGIKDGERLYEQQKSMLKMPFWYHLMSNKEMKCGERTDADFMRLYRCVDEITKAVEHQVFVPNISGESCTFCPYADPCGLPFKGSSQEEEEDEVF
jgi:CRISPR/Cas system-associated exonuclease Cas4 (RecB family)